MHRTGWKALFFVAWVACLTEIHSYKWCILQTSFVCKKPSCPRPTWKGSEISQCAKAGENWTRPLAAVCERACRVILHTSVTGALSSHRDSYFSFCRIRGGYAGVATYCNKATAQPVAAEDGLCGTVSLLPHKSSMGSSRRICFPDNQAFWSRQVRCISQLQHWSPRSNYNQQQAASNIERILAIMLYNTKVLIHHSCGYSIRSDIVIFCEYSMGK